MPLLATCNRASKGGFYIFPKFFSSNKDESRYPSYPGPTVRSQKARGSITMVRLEVY